MKMDRLRKFLFKCWDRPMKFEADNQKRLEIAMDKQISYFKYEMKISNLHFYGNKYVEENEERIKKDGKKMPTKFTFITMCKDEDMDVDM